MQANTLFPLSPSFSSFSNSKLAEIAARVVEEFRAETDAESEFFVDDDDVAFSCIEGGESLDHVEELGTETDTENEYFVDDEVGESTLDEKSDQKELEKDENHEEQVNRDDDDEQFEFAFVTRESEFSPISADEIFYNGQIRPIFPIFNGDLLLSNVEFKYESSGSVSSENVSVSAPPPDQSIRFPLRKLLIEAREAATATTSSCSSSEADDLERIPPGTYCVWRPKTVEDQSPGRCKKSNSTGSSKRWKFRDLINRSNSDGKDTFVFLTPSEKADAAAKNQVAGKGKPPPASINYSKKGGGDDKRKSFLPYRQDLVGLFVNLNGLSRNFKPF